MRASELKAEVAASGSHFFDRAAMKFFDSKLEFTSSGPMCTTAEYGGMVFFVTSEKAPTEGSKRRYTVRCWTRGTARYSTIGKFQQYATKDDARKAMYAAADAAASGRENADRTAAQS